MDLQDIKKRQQAGEYITPDELAFLLHNDINALVAFMIANNPGIVNLSLRKMGYTHLGFEPDRKALTQQMAIIIKNGDKQAFNAVTKEFEMQSQGLSEDFINAWKQYRK